MVVVSLEFLPNSEAAWEERDGKALLGNRFDEALDHAVGFRRVGSEPSMKDQTALKIESLA